MTSEKLKALSGYTSKAAAQIDTIFANLEDLIGSLGKIAGHVDALGDQVDKVSISLAEAAREMAETENLSAAAAASPLSGETGKKPARKAAKAAEPSLSLRDISPRGGDKGDGAKVDRPQSGMKGVNWNPRKQRWFVYRYEKGKKIYVGQYDDLADAKVARLQAIAPAEEPSLSLRDISPKGGDKAKAVKVTKGTKVAKKPAAKAKKAGGKK
jgi:hypothetical protein